MSLAWCLVGGVLCSCKFNFNLKQLDFFSFAQFYFVCVFFCFGLVFFLIGRNEVRGLARVEIPSTGGGEVLWQYKAYY